jgi:predicted outer membrane repeat protein
MGSTKKWQVKNSTIEGCEISEGTGGVIYVIGGEESELELLNVTISNVKAPSGGAIYVEGVCVCV